MKKIALLFCLAIITSYCGYSQSTNCTTATNLSLSNGSACVNGTSAGAITDNILYGSCNTAPVNMVWYTYVTNGSNNQFTITPNTLTNAEIVIYQGGCPNTGTLQNCVTATGSNPIVTSWGMTAGVQVWIGIASNGGVSGSFQFCVNSQPPAPGPGNTCAQAKLVCSTPFSQATIPSNSSGQKPSCFASAPQQDIWIKFTITQPGLLAWTATGNNATTEFDWALWDITNGCPGTLACCNYNYAAGSTQGFGMQAQTGTVACGTSAAAGTAAEFCGPMNVTCGKTYAIQISNYSNNNVGFSLSFAGSTALINSNAAFTITTPTLVCGSSLNASINNTSTGGCNEVWNYGDGSATYTGMAPPSHVYTTPGTYAITANIGGACPSSVTHFVQLLAPLAATANPSPVSCPGSCNGSATVNPVTGGDGIYTYSWSNGSTTNMASSLCAGIYTVTVSNAKCNSTVSQTVNVTSPPPLTLTASPVVAACGGNNGSITLSGSGGTAAYTYNMNGGAYSGTTVYNNLAAGVYTMGVKDSKNCTTSITVTITTSTGPTVTVNSATTCAGTPAVLTASGAASYTWSPATGLSSTTGASVSANPASSTTYTIIGATGGCTASTTSNLVVNPLPVVTATNSGPYCAGTTVQLGTGAFSTYTWTGPSFSSSIQNPSIASSSVSNSGTYSVTVSDVNGCVNTATTNVTVNPVPTPTAGSNSPVCLNNSINLTTSGGTSYSWSGPNGFTSVAQNPTIANASTVQAGVYTVTVTSLGCSNTASVSVSVGSPTTSASGGGPYCAGNTIQFTNPGATSYTWTGPAAFSSNVQNPTRPNATTAMSGIYTVVVSIGSCTASATTSVTVNALPTPTAGNPGPYCDGATIQLNTGAFTTYTWSGPGAFSSNIQNPSIPSSTVGNSGAYTVAVTDANGCVNTAVTNVTVNPTPNPVVGSNSPVCLNNSINLTATGGTSYSWSGPNSFSSSSQNPVIPGATTVQAGVYTVTVTALGCVNTGTTNVIVTTPTTSASGGGPYCAGSTIQLTNPGATSYTWTGPSAFSSNQQNPTRPNSTVAMSGIYTVVVTIGSCTASATTSLTVNALPTPVVNNSGPVCIGQPVSMSATGGVSYSWNGPSGFTSSAQNPSIAVTQISSGGVYVVTVTDANNCVNTGATTITINQQPVVNAAGSTVCENTNAQLTSGGGVSYSWSGPGGYTSSQQNPVITNAVPSNSGQYTVTVTDANTCTNTAVANVTVNPAPVINVSSNGPVCVNDALSLSATGGISYSWSGPAAFASILPNPTVVVTSTAMAGVYNVTGVAAGGCSGTGSINVVVNPLPTLSLTSGPNKGCAPLCVTYSLQSSPTASAVSWNFGNGLSGTTMNPNSCYTSPGVYSISANVTDIHGCSSAVGYTAEVYPKPTADFAYGPVKPIENLDQVSFTDISFGTPISSWNWYFLTASGQYTSAVQNPDFLYKEAGVYPVVLIVKSDHGCADTVLKTITVIEDFGIWVPNAFTPNGDGVNDTFGPKGFGVILKYNMQIFDRWGESIFYTDDFYHQWPGTYQGRGDKICQDDVYVWRITLVGANGKIKELVGHVTLLK